MYIGAINININIVIRKLAVRYGEGNIAHYILGRELRRDRNLTISQIKDVSTQTNDIFEVWVTDGQETWKWKRYANHTTEVEYENHSPLGGQAGPSFRKD